MKKTIKELLGLNPCAGDVGVEVEMEGPVEFYYEAPDNWRAESDGSLRGWSCEYVMEEPVHIDCLSFHMSTLAGFLDERETPITYTERAGVHVHVNVQELNLDQLATMAILYYVFEEALVKYCGENREGNHFCLRLKDAEAPIFNLESMIVGRNIYCLEDDLRYAAINFQSLFKYGSVEFRAMETREDLSRIVPFAKMVVALREWAKEHENIYISDTCSGFGPEYLAREVFGEELFNEINYPNFDKDAMMNLRRVQTLIYMV